ncbi:3-oxoacyl-ACP synthase III family protein [Nannocystaceae bacterium ST9]
MSLSQAPRIQQPRRPGNITALGVAFPRHVRTNAWWDDNYPELVRHAREATLAKVWADFGELSTYDRAIAPYLADPFRGTIERRVMSPDMSAQQLEVAAARAALDAGGLEVGDIDLVMIAALRPDSHVVGDAAFVARELGLRAPAIDFETACSSALVGFHLASDLVFAGRYRRILVIACCTYTRDVDMADSFSWFLGDGAAAFVVEPAREGAGLLGAHTIPTIETCGAFAYQFDVVEGRPELRIHPDKLLAGKSIRDASESFLRRCVDGALSEANLSLSDVDFLICNTPTAWYAEFCAKVLGFEDRTIDGYPRFANCGPVLWPNNLHTALREHRVGPDDVVLGFSVGSVSTASAVVFRLGEVALGSVEL